MLHPCHVVTLDRQKSKHQLYRAFVPCNNFITSVFLK